jgi:hypothetical protein
VYQEAGFTTFKRVWLQKCRNIRGSSNSRWVGTVLSRFLTKRKEASIGNFENTSPLGHTFPRKKNMLLGSSLQRTKYLCLLVEMPMTTKSSSLCLSGGLIIEGSDRSRLLM